MAAGAKLVKELKPTPPTMLAAAESNLPFLCSYIFTSSDQRVVKKGLLETDEQGRTPLLLAVSKGHKEVRGQVEDLLVW